MFFARLTLCLFAGVSASACARPTLSDLEDSGAAVSSDDAGADALKAPKPDEPEPGPTQSRDAGVNSSQRDATTSTQDSGCADRDGDGVCDSDDNCPDDANPSQDASACAAAPVDCQTDQLQAGAIGSSASLASLRINGSSDTVVRVKPGQAIKVSFSLQYAQCTVISLQNIFLGLESGQLDCQAAGCPVPIISSPPAFNYEFDLTAPQESGVHYLLAALESTVNPLPCSSTASSKATKRVAALCVTP